MVSDLYKTPCGVTFEHNWHQYRTKKGVAICDGQTRVAKQHPTDTKPSQKDGGG